MITFTDRRLYLKGTCMALCLDPNTSEVLYYTNKAATANLETSVTMGEIRAGLGNPVSVILPSDSSLNVTFTASDFNLWVKAAQVGATLNYNAVVPVCQTITATGTSLTLDVTDGAPVPFYGSGEQLCYVQETGVAGTMAATGTPYPISDAGAISGFTAVSGKTYKVWYYTNKASAQVATIESLFDPKVVTFIQQMAVYTNEGVAGGTGTRVGWLYAVVPFLKLGANAGIVGDQSNADTTELSGQAVAFDSDVVSATCANCEASALAYYIYAPDDAAESISGLAVVGGVVSLAKSATAQIPVKLVMANGELVTPNPYTLCSYTGAGLPTGTSVSTAGVVTAGTTAGNGEVTIAYPATGTAEYECVINVEVTN